MGSKSKPFVNVDDRNWQPVNMTAFIPSSFNATVFRRIEKKNPHNNSASNSNDVIYAVDKGGEQNEGKVLCTLYWQNHRGFIRKNATFISQDRLLSEFEVIYDGR